MRLTDSGSLFKKLAVAAGVASAGVLLSLPAVALDSLVSQTGSESNQVNPANPDAEGGEAFEEAPSGQPLPSETTEPMNDSMNEGGTMMDESTGGGAGGVNESEVNPANPDAEGGEAFEQAPGAQPLPSETTEPMNDSMNEGGTMMDESTGGGAGGVNESEVNPANPDAEGGEAFERAPGTQPLPTESNQTSPSGTTQDGSYDSQGGATSGDGVGGGAGGGSSAVRALW